MPAHDLAAFRAFRSLLHGCFPRRADALFELGDALLAADSVASLPHVSLQAAHRRGSGSLYDALAEGRLDVEALRAALAQYPAIDRQPVYAVDLSVWPRCDTEASPERDFYYHASRHTAGQPIVAGWAYQWVAQLSFARDSWTPPVTSGVSIRPRTLIPSPLGRSRPSSPSSPEPRPRACSSSTPATIRRT